MLITVLIIIFCCAQIVMLSTLGNIQLKLALADGLMGLMPETIILEQASYNWSMRGCYIPEMWFESSACTYEINN